MSETRAYRLAAQYASDNEQEAFSGGSVALGQLGETLDIKTALDDGGGTIVTDDPTVIAALDNFPALVRTTAGDTDADPTRTAAGEAQAVEQERAAAGAEAAKRGEVDAAEFGREDLNNMARQAGIPSPEHMPNKGAVADAINAANDTA